MKRLSIIALISLAVCISACQQAKATTNPQPDSLSATAPVTSIPEPTATIRTGESATHPPNTPRPAPEAHLIELKSMLADIAGFLNQRVGYVLARTDTSDRFVTLHTVDGGITWASEHLQLKDCGFTCNPAGLDVVSEKLMWLTTSDGRIYFSTDAGKIWQDVTSPSPDEPLPFASFVDALNGWVASTSHLYATQDGGKTWTRLALPAGLQQVAVIALRSPSEGYVLDSAGILYQTTDGGQVWNTQNLMLDKAVLVSPTLAMAAMRFTNAKCGMIVLGMVNDEGQVWALTTNNGGQTWEKTRLPTNLGTFHLAHDGATLTSTKSMNITLVSLGAP